MWVLPADIWKEILVHPQCARALSYTCSAAALALRGIFSVTLGNSGASITYTLTGRHHQSQIIFRADSVRTPAADWVSLKLLDFPMIDCVHGGVLKTKKITRVDGDNVVVIADEYVFMSTRDQMTALAAVIGVPGIGITEIYNITCHYENFRGVPLVHDSTRGKNAILVNESWDVVIAYTNAAPADIRGRVTALELAYDKSCFCPRRQKTSWGGTRPHLQRRPEALAGKEPCYAVALAGTQV